MSTGCLLESLKNSNEFHRKPVWLAERDSHQLLFYLYFWLCMWHVGSWFLDQGSNPSPLHWKLRVLAMGLPGKCHNHQLFILVTPCEILQWVPELLSHSPWDWAFDFLLPAESGFQGQPLKQMLLTDVGLIGSIFGGGLRQMLRHRENFIFYNTVSPPGMAQLSSWGSEVYPPFLGLILNFLKDISKLKEIRVDEALEVGMESWVDLRDI